MAPMAPTKCDTRGKRDNWHATLPSLSERSRALSSSATGAVLRVERLACLHNPLKEEEHVDESPSTFLDILRESTRKHEALCRFKRQQEYQETGLPSACHPGWFP